MQPTTGGQTRMGDIGWAAGDSHSSMVESSGSHSSCQVFKLSGRAEDERRMMSDDAAARGHADGRM